MYTINMLKITYLLTLLLFVLLIPSTTLAYPTKGSELGTGYFFDVGPEDSSTQTVFMFAPKGWDFLDRSDGGAIYFSKSYLDGSDGGIELSVDEFLINPSDYDKKTFNPKGKSKAWFVKNFFKRKDFFLYVENLIYKKVKIAEEAGATPGHFP